MWYVAKHTAVAFIFRHCCLLWALDWAHLGGGGGGGRGESILYARVFIEALLCSYGNSHYILVVIKIIVV